jgi:uncharacterized membrane protein
VTTLRKRVIAALLGAGLILTAGSVSAPVAQASQCDETDCITNVVDAAVCVVVHAKQYKEYLGRCLTQLS